jgi:carbon monoxide dehydrogenase subunit G
VELSSAVRIRRPAAEVFDALLDAGKVAACLPGSHLIGEVADGTYAGQIELTIGPIDAVYAGTVRLDAADRNTGTVTLSASGRERAGQGSADAHVAVRVEPDGAGARVLISADLMIRGTVAQYAPGTIGEVSQRLVEQFAGNVERLLASQAGPSAGAAARPPALPAKRAAAAVLLGAGVLTALAIWRMRARAISPLNDSSEYYPHGGARHG